MPDEEALARFHERGYSTCVASLEYDPETNELIIEFQERGTYKFYDVPPDEADGLRGATSQGTYYNLYIKGRYSYDRIG